jgi:hypothetical protein
MTTVDDSVFTEQDNFARGCRGSGIDGGLGFGKIGEIGENLSGLRTLISPLSTSLSTTSSSLSSGAPADVATLRACKRM